MKIEEVISEAKFDPNIRKAMIAKGYRLLGKGQDQDAFLAPDGTILKIFGTAADAQANRYSNGQQSLIDFANYCQANPGNPFLPTFGGIERFEFDGNYYLQIQCERLFELNGAQKAIARGLEDIDYIVRADVTAKKNLDKILYHIKTSYGGNTSDQLIQSIIAIGGEEALMTFIQTIIDLDKIAERKGYRSDLHAGNFMASSDGDIVINDPFFTGTWRQ